MKLQALAFIGFMGGMKLCDYVFFDNVSNNHNTKLVTLWRVKRRHGRWILGPLWGT